MNPIISYIIATKNRADVIGETLHSLIDQTESNWEAVVINSNSHDDTQKIVDNFHDKRIRYYDLSPAHGCGASSARNFGAIYAHSDIVAILDSDDICYANRTKITVDAFLRDSSLDVFYADIDLWYEKTGVIENRKISIAPFSLERLKKEHFIPHPTLALKRQVLLDNPYNQFFKIAEDYELITRLALQRKKFAYSNEKVLKYRISDDNISRGQDKSEVVKNYGEVAKMARGWVEFNPKILQMIDKYEERLI